MQKQLYFKQILFYKRILKKITLGSLKILSNTTVFNIDNIRNVSWAQNQHTRIISAGSCDTLLSQE